MVYSCNRKGFLQQWKVYDAFMLLLLSHYQPQRCVKCLLNLHLLCALISYFSVELPRWKVSLLTILFPCADVHLPCSWLDPYALFILSWALLKLFPVKPMPKQLFTGCICLCDGGMRLSLDADFSVMKLRHSSFDVHAQAGWVPKS